MAELQYRSTRGGSPPVTSAQAILQGIADDGGLFVPTRFPEPIRDLDALPGMSYRDLAYDVMQGFLPDYTEAELRECIARAYDGKFATPLIAPLVEHAGVHFLELYHGPTLAFKDMALAILPHLLKTAARKREADYRIVILTATSGDTGKAALEGFAGVEGTDIIVFFPENGVSEIQKRQMVTTEGSNTHVVGVEGNFDDCQNGVKAILGDAAFLRRVQGAGCRFSSANSINAGRLIPQVVYYFYAYAQLCRSGALRPGEPANFVVPTGNFGNILAAYYAGHVGLPIGKLVCASNDNKVLYDFIRTGVYDRNRDFVTTISPSMDILISSNLERLLFALAGDDPELVRRLMADLAGTGRYEVPLAMREGLASFVGGWAPEEETRRAIREVWERSGYLIDTHTAVGYAVYRDYVERTGDHTPAVVTSTASPYKFTRDVLAAIGRAVGGRSDFELVKEMAALLGSEIPPGVRDLDRRPIRHRTVCEKGEMPTVVSRILGLG